MTHLVKKTSHVRESVTSAALRLSPRQLHNLLTQMPLKNFAIAFNQGLNLQKRHHHVSLVVKVTVDRSSSRCRMNATKTLELELKKSWTWSSSFDVVLRATDILNFRMRALFKRPRRSSKNQTRSRPQSGRRRRSMRRPTNWQWQKRSRKINLKFLAGGFPALMVENRFQALPETSNRRFSLAEISGTGLICDWQNFWEKKKNSNTGIMQCGRSEKETKTFHERPHMFQKGPICFRKDLYVSKEPHMFEKETHMLPICCAFWRIFFPTCWKSSICCKPGPHMQPICSPYVAHMFRLQ